MFCVKCGVEINDGLDLFDYCPKCGTVLFKEVVVKEEVIDIPVDDNKQESYERAASLNRFFSGSVLLKIIGVIIKIICLPLILIFYILGYFLSFVAGIGNLVVGLFLMLAAIMFIVGLFEFFSDTKETLSLFTSLALGVILSILAVFITAVPALFIGIAQLLTFFVFGSTGLLED